MNKVVLSIIKGALKGFMEYRPSAKRDHGAMDATELFPRCRPGVAALRLEGSFSGTLAATLGPWKGRGVEELQR